MILCDLVEGEKTAGELQRFSRLSQSAFSQHLKVLREDGLRVMTKAYIVVAATKQEL